MWSQLAIWLQFRLRSRIYVWHLNTAGIFSIFKSIAEFVNRTSNTFSLIPSKSTECDIVKCGKYFLANGRRSPNSIERLHHVGNVEPSQLRRNSCVQRFIFFCSSLCPIKNFHLFHVENRFTLWIPFHLSLSGKPCRVHSNTNENSVFCIIGHKMIIFLFIPVALILPEL